MANGNYDDGKGALATATINLESNSIKVLLVNHDYVFDPTHSFTTIQGYEVSGNNYNQGGSQLQNQDIIVDTSAHKARLWASDLTWQTITVADIRGAVLYDSTYGTPIYYWDFAQDYNPIGQDFTLQWDDTDGVIYLY